MLIRPTLSSTLYPPPSALYPPPSPFPAPNLIKLTDYASVKHGEESLFAVFIFDLPLSLPSRLCHVVFAVSSLPSRLCRLVCAIFFLVSPGCAECENYESNSPRHYPVFIGFGTRSTSKHCSNASEQIQPPDNGTDTLSTPEYTPLGAPGLETAPFMTSLAPHSPPFAGESDLPNLGRLWSNLPFYD